MMQNLLGLRPAEMSRVFAGWNTGDLDSFLVGITADILSRTDPESGEPLVDVILDRPEQKGTGKWASESALELGVAAPAIADAVFARAVAALRDERRTAAGLLRGPQPAASAGRDDLLENIRDALLAAMVCAYAQGFQVLAAADREHQWQLPLATIAAIWRAGCIIRARLLDDIRSAYARHAQLANLLLDPELASVMARCEGGLRASVVAAAQQGLPVPGFMSTLAYYDAYRSGRLPANLLQAQRDFFGAHGYERVDRPGKFHTAWG
jgi:6-phosphogluconate dehydrogenase